VNIPFSRSRAKLVSVTCCDQRFFSGSGLDLLFLAAIAQPSYPVICVGGHLHEANNICKFLRSLLKQRLDIVQVSIAVQGAVHAELRGGCFNMLLDLFNELIR
jgi:hypothetical protein